MQAMESIVDDISAIFVDPSTVSNNNNINNNGAAQQQEEAPKEPLTIEELETRIWRDRVLLRKMKDERRERDKCKTYEQLKKKTMSRAQDGILRYISVWFVIVYLLCTAVIFLF